MNCRDCKNRPILDDPREQYYVDYITMNANDANRRAFISNVILSVLLAGCIIALLLVNRDRIRLEEEVIQLERDYETVETYTYDYNVEQEADEYGKNYFSGRDLTFYGDEAEGYSDRNEDADQDS